MSRWALAALWTVALGFVCMAGLLAGVYVDMLRGEDARPSDCIIVPGCKVTGSTPSLSLQSRLDCAIRLYKDGYAHTIIVCGAQGETGNITEAQAMRNYLLARNIPGDAILLDENSFSTLQNMRNSKALMDARGFSSAIVATSDFHAARAVACARLAGIESVSCAKARFAWPDKWVFVLREIPGWGKYLLLAAGLAEE